MASYDDGGKTGNKSCYVLEAGDYKIYVGSDVRSSALVYTHNIPALRVTETCEEVMAPTRNFNRIIPAAEQANGTFAMTTEAVPQRVINPVTRLQSRLSSIPSITPVATKTNRLIDVYNGTITMDQFIAQLTDNDLAALTMGEEGSYVVSGSAGSFGGVTTSLRNMGIPRMCAADGPAGVRTSSPASCIPTGTNLGCTWNAELVEELFKYLGMEMNLNNVDSFLAPGIEVHRYPLNGRHFEYFTESLRTTITTSI